MPDLLSRALGAFDAAFAGAPRLIGRGPGRVNLIGEHTDYNEGFALPFAIDRSTLAAISPRADRRVRLVTDFADGVVETDLDSLDEASRLGWAAYPLGVAWALGEAGVDLSRVSGLDIALVSDVPVGAGLSSSAAIETAVAVALDELWGLGFDRRALARVGQRAENIVVGALTGILDQSASLLGEADAAVLLDCRTLETEILPLGLDEAGIAVLVMDSRVKHAHVDGGYGARRAACESGAAALGVRALRDVGPDDLDRARGILDEVTFRRVRHVVTENQRVLDTVATLRREGPRAVGGLLLASHASMRDDFEISTPELDAAVEAAMGAGAIGARMTGGGFGGSAIALVESASVPAVTDAVRRAYHAAGFAEPGLMTVRAVAGASLVAPMGA